MRGMIFKPDSIGAIIEGRKTQTRRLGGLKEINREPNRWEYIRTNDDGRFLFWVLADDPEPNRRKRTYLAKPLYEVGETVYIKEAWAVDALWDNKKPSEINHLASVWHPHACNLMNISQWVGKFRSPLFMPEWAARYFITITDVRAERLQEITEIDAFAEGYPFTSQAGIFAVGYKPWKVWFSDLWNSINKTYAWEMNPWVWVYTFRLKQ